MASRSTKSPTPSRTRRVYRRVFRRARFYLPFFVLLFFVMLFVLPLSAPWLRSQVESEVGRSAGIPVEIGSLRLLLWQGRVEAEAIRVGVESGGEPFTISRLEARGDLTDLLGGGGRWPQTLLLAGFPLAEFERTDDFQYQLGGVYRRLVDELRDGVAGRAPTQGDRPSPRGVLPSLPVPTPEIILRGLPMEFDPPMEDLPPLRLTFEEIRADPRLGRRSPLVMTARGSLAADTLETFRFSAQAFPDEGRVALDGSLSGFSFPIDAGPLGRFFARTEDLAIDAGARLPQPGIVQLNATLRATRFVLAQDRPGGERWADQPLIITFRARIDLDSRLMEVNEFSLQSETVDVSAAGRLTAGGNWPAAFRLNIGELPPAAINLARNELVERSGIEIDALASTSTLRLDAGFAGDLRRPGTGTISGAVRFAGWRFSAPFLPSPVDILGLDAGATTETLNLASLRLRSGDLEVEAEGRIPLLGPGHARTGRLRVEARGTSRQIVDILDRRGRLPAELLDLDVPLILNASIDASARRDPRSVYFAEVDPDTLEIALTWRDGTADVRLFPEPLRILPGNLRYARQRFQLQRLSAMIEGVQTTVRGTVEADLFDLRPEAARFDAIAFADARLPEVISVLRRVFSLPRLPRNLDGDLYLEATARGTFDRLPERDYSLRAVLERGAATLDLPHSSIPVSGVTVDLVLTPEVLEIRRLRARAPDEQHGNSTIDLSGDITGEAVRLAGSARAHLEALANWIPEIFRDVYMAGLIPAEIRASLTPARPLPQAPDMLRRWLALLRERPSIHFDPAEAPDLLLDYEAVLRQESPVAAFYREFPVPIENIRGDARFTTEGLVVSRARVDIGSAKDVFLSGSLEPGRPVAINFVARADQLDANEWMEGWGQREWASSSHDFSPRWKTVDESYQFIDIQGHIEANSVRFLTFEAGKTSSDFFFEAWSRQRPVVRFANIATEAYGGSGAGTATLEVLMNDYPLLDIEAQFEGASIDGYLDDLYLMDQQLDGYMTGNLRFRGQTLNYPTHEGDAEFTITESSVVGTMVLVYARDLLRLTNTVQSSRVTGTCSLTNEVVTFKNLIISNPNITLVSNGTINFRGELDFEVTASVLSQQVSKIPVVGQLSRVYDALGNTVVAYRVRGTLDRPRVTPVQPVLDRLSGIARNLLPGGRER